jgi:hypothetical protein
LIHEGTRRNTKREEIERRKRQKEERDRKKKETERRKRQKEASKEVSKHAVTEGRGL